MNLITNLIAHWKSATLGLALMLCPLWFPSSCAIFDPEHAARLDESRALLDQAKEKFGEAARLELDTAREVKALGERMVELREELFDAQSGAPSATEVASLREEIGNLEDAVSMAIEGGAPQADVDRLNAELARVRRDLADGVAGTEQVEAIQAALTDLMGTMLVARTNHESAMAALDMATAEFKKAKNITEDLEEETGFPSWLLMLLQATGFDVFFRGAPSKGIGGAMLARFVPESQASRDLIAARKSAVTAAAAAVPAAPTAGAPPPSSSASGTPPSSGGPPA